MSTQIRSASHCYFKYFSIGFKRPLIASYAILSVFAVAAGTSTASAQDIRFTPINPSFGGNPFNSAHLLGIAGAQNNQVDPATLNVDNSGPTQSDLFIRQLQSRLLSSLAREVTDAIFGDEPQDSGVVVFGDQTVSFDRGLDSVSLTILDSSTGTETAIQIPTFGVGAAPTLGAAGVLGSVATTPAPTSSSLLGVGTLTGVSDITPPASVPQVPAITPAQTGSGNN